MLNFSKHLGFFRLWHLSTPVIVRVSLHLLGTPVTNFIGLNTRSVLTGRRRAFVPFAELFLWANMWKSLQKQKKNQNIVSRIVCAPNLWTIAIDKKRRETWRLLAGKVRPEIMKDFKYLPSQDKFQETFYFDTEKKLYQDISRNDPECPTLDPEWHFLYDQINEVWNHSPSHNDNTVQ